MVIGGTFAVGWCLWPDGFLHEPIATLTHRSVLLAAGSMGVLAVASLMALFAVTEPIAALVTRLQDRRDRNSSGTDC